MTVRAIFVVNSRGEWQDSSGSSREVSNPADLQYLIASRRWCDLIVSSGKTVRNNKYSPTKKPLWIISKQADAFVDLVAMGARVLPASAAEALAIAKVNYRNILCEFGPESLNEVINSDLLDEFDLSVTGRFNPVELDHLMAELPMKISILSQSVVHEADELVVFRFILKS